jgi:actin related protein 2/3 complex, subunit 1A/1B
MIKKKFKSSVTCLAFHPSNSQIIATGSTDFKCRILSTFLSKVDGTTVDPGPFASTHGPLEFGEAYAELTTNGWVHAVAWSPSGNALAYATHESKIYVSTLGLAVDPPTQVIRLNDLPVCSLLFISDNAFIGAGYDFNPLVFKYNRSNRTWTYHAALDNVDAGKDATPAVAETSNASKARELFRAKTIRGQDSKADSDILKTKHERFINCLRNGTRSGAGGITTVSTSSYDGKLVVWELPSLDINFAQLSL